LPSLGLKSGALAFPCLELLQAALHHRHRPAVVLVIVEDALELIRIALAAVLVKPLDGSGAGGVFVAPGKAAVLGEGFDG
jgi:hypothetical protein